jgi:PAS domain S-box-containing protein
LLGIYTFSTLNIASFVAVFLLISSNWAAPLPEGLLVAILILSLVFVVATPALRGRFQNLVDRHVLGIRHSPDEVIDLVSERIPQSFDRAVLAQVVSREIVPSLLVRQSALYLLEDSETVTLYEQGLPGGESKPTVSEVETLQGHAGRYLHPGSNAVLRSWVRLVIPLTIQSRTIGVWLIGRRDPDDFYPAADIHLLSTVANQIAPMVENIRLYEQAQQEIAHRKAAEEAIRRSEERFRTLFEATLEGIAIVRNGEILEVNQALVPIFGYPPDEIIGRRLTDLVAEGSTALSAVPHETVGTRRDGTPVNIEIAGKKYVFQGEDVTVVAVRDIAKRKRDEAERKDLQRQLVLSQKMEAIGRLSAGVAHDFNNCLLAIFGYSDLLLDRYRAEPFLARNLSGIKEAGQKAAALTKQLLAFARRQPLETRVMNLNEVVLGLSKMLQRLLGEDIALVTELHPKLGNVKIDPGQIEQVILNLAVNARQAMPGGGRLTVKTGPYEARPGEPAAHSELRGGGYVLLTVSDTGVGMDPETQVRIFEPFFTTKGEGTGLGLSTAYGIVKQSGGHIFVDSVLGHGACFSIFLPVTAERESLLVASQAVPTDFGTETILLVEDEDEVREVLVQILMKKGYQVLAACSGDEALTIAKRHSGPLDLLLTDVTMPRMKGPQLAEHLFALSPETKVIFMSGYNDEPLAEAGRICLQKPFAPPVLTRTIRAVLDAGRQERVRRPAVA